MDSPFLKDAAEGASATEAEREFHNGIVRGEKLNLNESEDVEYCLSFLEWAALVLVVDGVSTTLYNRLIWIFDRLDSSVSHCR